MTICSIPGCEREMLARGWCVCHYQCWRRGNDPLKYKPRKPRKVVWKAPAQTPRRDELDHLRRVLCDAFMKGDLETCGKAAQALKEMLR